MKQHEEYSIIGRDPNSKAVTFNRMCSLTVALVIGIIFLSGCGQDRNHKPLSKIEVFSKSLINTEKEYLYVPSTDEVSRTTRVGRPFFQGDQKIVKFKFEKDFLVAYSQEKDIRFDDNVTNNRPVFRIPISHIDYREAQDPFGEGTNIEEKNEYLPWNERKYFEPKPQEFEFSDVSTLPVELENIFGSTCSRKVGQSELSFEVKKDRVDIVIKRDFTSNIYCVDDVRDLSDLAWSEVTQHSLVPMENLVSENYEKVIYEREWERKFGFFETLDKVVDSANNDTQDQEIYYMNRWNPKREVITYHLDPRFEKPENYSIKQATLLGFQRLNDGLASAGVNFRLVAVDGAKDLRPGDLTVSSIVLVEDPLAVGLLGYGPSVANPRTGEIVQARTVMYPGVMKQFIQRAYDELIDQERVADQNPTANVGSVDPNTLNEDNQKALQQINEAMQRQLHSHNSHSWAEHKGELSKLNDLNNFKSKTKDSIVSTNSGFDSESSIEAVSGSDSLKPSGASRSLSTTTNTSSVSALFPDPVSPKSSSSLELIKMGADAFFNDTRFSLRSIFNSFKEKKENEFDLDRLDAIEVLSKHNMTPARLEAFVDIKDGDLKDKILELGKGQDWHLLDETVRKQIVDLVMPYVWIPTLIHEVGHNLGLRHNFAGSEDQSNFYKPEELKNLGLDSEFGSPYASMMEYPKSEITGLRVPGKYDIAALRYGYLQKVELDNGTLVNAPAKPDEVTLKNFEYCSDEGVALNPNCKRFDEGIGFVGIANSIIDSYWENYKLRNSRRGRANFSMYDEIMHAAGINQQFRTLRLMLERFTDIVIDFGVPMSEVEKIEFLKDLNDATKISADFLMNIVAEADYSCVVFQNGQFYRILKFSEIQTELGVFTGNFKKCSEVVGLPGGLMIVGELGRRYNNEKFSDNPNIYLDQIDIRGVWFDKLLALRYLVARNLNEYSFDDYTLSFLDHPEIGNTVNEFVKNVILGDISYDTEISFIDGTKSKFTYAHHFSDGYQIKKPLLPFFHWSLRLPYDQIDLAEAMIRIMKNQLNAGLDSISNQLLKETIEVKTYIPIDGRDPSMFEIYKLGRTNFVAAPENEVALKVFDRLKKIEVYETLSREQLIAIYTAIVEKQQLPLSAVPNEVIAYGLGEADLFLYLTNGMPSKDYYNRVLGTLTL